MNEIKKLNVNGTEYSLGGGVSQSLAASQNGTDLSLVTTGEKYTWNSNVNVIEQQGQGTAAALTDLYTKILDLAGVIEEKELAIAASLTKLDQKDPTVNYNLVDMGLPSGRLWADRNIGAASPTDGGLYFQWGDIEGFSKDSGRYCSGERNSERDWSGDYGRCRGSELGDSQNIPADPYFDAARKNMGSPWRMPTKAEIQELFNSSYTTNQWVTNYQGSGINGRLVTSKANGNTLFFPAAGFFDGGFYGFGSDGGYWSSSYNDEKSAYLLNFYSGDVSTGSEDNRYCGYSVRAVQ